MTDYKKHGKITTGSEWSTRARERFRKLVRALRLKPSTESTFHIMECLAVSFLSVNSERLVWAIDGKATYLGERLEHRCEEPYFVAALLVQTHKGLECSLHLPYSAWVADQSKVTAPTYTAKVCGGSTLSRLRVIACSMFRILGFDVRFWSTKAEAWDNNTAFEIATSATVDFTLAIPNGNRAARMREALVAPWMHEACFYLCSSLKRTSGTATVFLGDGDLSPGIPYPEVYTEIISSLQRGLQALHVPVIRKVSGVKHLEDGVHWSTASKNAVCMLITRAIDEARSCTEFVQTPELPY